MHSRTRRVVIVAALAAIALSGQGFLNFADTPVAATATTTNSRGWQTIPLYWRTSPKFPPGFGEITSYAYGCLDAMSQSIGDGDQIQLWRCTGNDNQLWGFNVDTFEIVNYVDQERYCLDAQEQSIGNGDKVQLWQCSGETQQTWCYAFELPPGSCAPYGNYTIVNFDGDYCLDATTPGWGSRDKVQLWMCNGRTEQNWEPF